MAEESQKSEQPWLEITEQPGTRDFRFGRGRRAQCIPGASSTSENKTYPTIKIHGYTGGFNIGITCVSVDEPYVLHPHNLTGEHCINGVYTKWFSNTDTVSFPQLKISCARKRSITERLGCRRALGIDPFQTGFTLNRRAIDLKATRLCFHLIRPNKQGDVTPVVSQPLYHREYKDENSPLFLKKHLFKQVEEQSTLCDVVIQVGAWRRNYHWCVLTVIPFFNRLYASDMTEKQSGLVNFSIGTPYSVQTALDFLYGREPDVGIDTAYELIEMADFLMIDELKQCCIDKLQSFEITLENCISLLLICSRFDISISKFHRFYLSHLPELMMTDKMIEIDKEAIRVILTDPTLSYVSREEAFTFLLKWTAVNFERKAEFGELLIHFDKGDIRPEFLNTVKSNYPGLLNVIEQFRPELVSAASHDKAVSGKLFHVLLLYPPLQNHPDVIFYAFDLERKCWYRIRVPFRGDCHTPSPVSVVRQSGSIYELTSSKDTVFIYNLTSGRFCEKRIIFQKVNMAYMSDSDAFAISSQKMYFVKNFRDVVLSSPQAGELLNGNVVDQTAFQTTADVYVSDMGDNSNSEISMTHLFSVNGPVDAVCTAEEFVCLLNRQKRQLSIHSPEGQIKRIIDLSLYTLSYGNGIMSSNGSDIYILTSQSVVNIQFHLFPNEVLWETKELAISEEIFAGLDELSSDKIVRVINNGYGPLTLQCRKIDGKGCDEEVLNIDMPTELQDQAMYQILELQLPKQALKCHIDCPHCKSKRFEQNDPFSYLRSFSSAENTSASEIDEEDMWFGNESDNSERSDSSLEEN